MKYSGGIAVKGVSEQKSPGRSSRFPGQGGREPSSVCFWLSYNAGLVARSRFGVHNFVGGKLPQGVGILPCVPTLTLYTNHKTTCTSPCLLGKSLHCCFLQEGLVATSESLHSLQQAAAAQAAAEAAAQAEAEAQAEARTHTPVASESEHEHTQETYAALHHPQAQLHPGAQHLDEQPHHPHHHAEVCCSFSHVRPVPSVHQGNTK